ncbi:hypothetical protein BH23PLA1_BH23PLA1_11350 [soil metagenome]
MTTTVASRGGRVVLLLLFWNAFTPQCFGDEGPRHPSGPLGLLFSPFSMSEDPDGLIQTDRPSFTPANSLVPQGRLLIETGYSFSNDRGIEARTATHLFPELAVRLGLHERAELRFFWPGQVFSTARPRSGGPVRRLNGPTDMEVGFKWQLLEPVGWVPRTALISSMFVPTGGGSSYSSRSVRPFVHLLYGWELTDRLEIAATTAYIATRWIDAAEPSPRDSSQVFAQSLIAFYSATDRATLFYEWFLLQRLHPSVDRAEHYMDGGLLYRITPNTQFDLRAGFGLGDHPDDFFAGAGFSVRY